MRRLFVALSLVSIAGCADDSGGPRVATDAQPPAAGPVDPAKPGVGKGKGVSAPSPPGPVSGTAPLQP
jgi:hypothetical protein